MAFWSDTDIRFVSRKFMHVLCNKTMSHAATENIWSETFWIPIQHVPSSIKQRTITNVYFIDIVGSLCNMDTLGLLTQPRPDNGFMHFHALRNKTSETWINV